jgi:hypothetical protein
MGRRNTVTRLPAPLSGILGSIPCRAPGSPPVPSWQMQVHYLTHASTAFSNRLASSQLANYIHLQIQRLIQAITKNGVKKPETHRIFLGLGRETYMSNGWISRHVSPLHCQFLTKQTHTRALKITSNKTTCQTYVSASCFYATEKNYMTLVRERTIPTERPPACQRS